MLPLHPARLHELIGPYASRVMMDPLNYRTQVSGVFRRQAWDYALTDAYAQETREALRTYFKATVRETTTRT